MEPITVSRMTDLATRLSGTYINVDGAAGNQCWDAAARVAQLLGLPVVNTWGEGRWPGWAGNMWDAYPQTPEIEAAYERVGPDQPGQPGDTAIWGDSDPYYPSTHVANVVRDFGAQLLCISQNSSAARPDLPGYSAQSSGPTILQHLPKRGLLGYLRPRVSTIAPQSSTTNEEYEVISDADVERIAKAAVAKIMTEQKGGNTLGELIAEERPHHLSVIEAVEKGPSNITIHPVQAEAIVSSTVERIDGKLNGRKIDAGQADDIAQAAARYSEGGN
jgi:hypothetical protein